VGSTDSSFKKGDYGELWLFEVSETPMQGDFTKKNQKMFLTETWHVITSSPLL